METLKAIKEKVTAVDAIKGTRTGIIIGAVAGAILTENQTVKIINLSVAGAMALAKGVDEKLAEFIERPATEKPKQPKQTTPESESEF